MTKIIIRKTTVASLVHNYVQIKFKIKSVCWPQIEMPFAIRLQRQQLLGHRLCYHWLSCW